MKTWRQSKILELIAADAISSQEALRQKLAAQGIVATQATLSRDLKDLALVKRAGDGAYVRAGDDRGGAAANEQLRRAVLSLVRGMERVDQLIVVRTDPGQAQGLAVLMDKTHATEAAGTIAGDDTILIICRGPEAAAGMHKRLDEMVRA